MHRMSSATRRVRKFVGHLLLCPLALSCVPFRRSPPAEPPIANRLVLALDGVDYRDIMAARARGLFASFRPPSRLVSTFPSISDIAWHDMLGVQPPPGYQRIFYSARQNAVVGELLDAITPIEYERRMDLAFGLKLHHLAAYLMSDQVARQEVDVDVRQFLARRGRSTVYAYNVGPDALQHTRGDLAGYLAHLDKKLIALQHEYRRRTGRVLEIVILSDHGHNRAVAAEFLPVVEALKVHGFHVAPSLVDPGDVAFSVDGVTTGFGVFAHPDSVMRVASLLAALDGVAVVSTRDARGAIVVRARDAMAEIITRQRGDTMLYRYRPLVGDPLGYTNVLARMTYDRAVSADSFATAATWLRYTAAEPFPAAPPRIVAGHTTVTLNPAPILVSLDDKVRVGLGAVSVANRMRPLGGTHGALSATNSLGVVMSNVVDTHDDLTSTVRQQFGGFDDLYDPRTRASFLSLSTPAMLRRDRWSGFSGPVVPDAVAALADTTALLQLSLSDADARWIGETARLRVEIRRDSAGAKGDGVRANSDAVASAWMRSPDGRVLVIAASALSLDRQPPWSALVLRVVAERDRDPAATGTGAPRRVASRTLATLRVRTDGRGAVSPY